MADNITDVTDTNFQAEVLENDTPVLVDFWAPWCGPCRMVSPILEEIANERDDVRVVKLNTDDNQQTAVQYQVLAIPTMILFRVVRRSSGSRERCPRSASRPNSAGARQRRRLSVARRRVVALTLSPHYVEGQHIGNRDTRRSSRMQSDVAPFRRATIRRLGRQTLAGGRADVCLASPAAAQMPVPSSVTDAAAPSTEAAQPVTDAGRPRHRSRSRKPRSRSPSRRRDRSRSPKPRSR